MNQDKEFMKQYTRDLETRKAACKILGVPENADNERLKQAYKRAAIEYHPDHNENTEEANRKFKLIKCAYELLAFDKSCDKLLDEINRWSGVPEDSSYNLDNRWGHFLWWKKRFFEPEDNNKGKKQDRPNSCI